MSNKKLSTRREFLKSSATTAGGLIIAFHLPSVAEAKVRPYEGFIVENEEMNAWLVIDVDDTITIRVAQAEMGQGVFTSMPMIVAEELEADWRTVRAEYADANRSIREDRVYRRMSTGGSGAVRRSRPYLQLAGAEARERLIKAAAEKWNASSSECYADYGKIYHKPTRRSLSYGELASAAAKISVGKVSIKTPEEFGLLGLPVKRLDTPSKVDGSAVFGMDVRVPNMVYAAVVHCPVIGGTMRSFRFNAVRNLPGVIQAVKLDHGVAIVAETYWQAKTAIEKLPVQWNIGDEGKTNSDTFRNEFSAILATEGTIVREEGDTRLALESSEKIIESDYYVPYLAHACMEPLNCTVSVQKDRVDIWAGMQNPESALHAVSKAIGFAPEDIYPHNCFLGGGFGRRSNTDFVVEAAIIAKEAGLPVQMIWSREEDTRAGSYRPMAAMRFKAGFDLDSELTAYTNHSVTHSILKDMGSDVSNGIDSSSVEGLENMPYEIPKKKITHTIKNTHIPTWWWRAVGSSQNAFAMECFVDEMATAAKIDPLAYRKKLLSNRQDLLNVLYELEEKSAWSRSPGKGRARGMAIHECFGTIVAQAVEVSVDKSGRAVVHKVVSVVDCGNLVNPLIAEMQIESGIIYGLSAALYGKITIEKGRVQESNFDTYQMVRMQETPVMETHWKLSGGDKWGGIGEPGLPCIAPAVVNALYQITKRRIRSLPIGDYFLQKA
ncbi:MAG: isoquinoline 1-oxidoreductase beta subunit [Candidatus Azotimanducaceae bacterium]|jgi:isoquinoline 1-oxidoreductase beta subunit